MRKKTIDPAKCVGCRNCELACIVVHSPDENLQQAYREGGISAVRSRTWVGLADDGSFFPQHCRHCEDPQCVRACMSGALSKGEDGYVVCDEEICVGCYMCVMSCPHGVARPSTSGRRVMLKCDACASRDEMACVAACRTDCLKVEEADLQGDIVEYINQPGAGKEGRE
jgi:carbon-monoxide dehydrogenase iron sulfur subunit